MNKDVTELAEEHELLHPSPLLCGEAIDEECEEFEEPLESVVNIKEWESHFSTYYNALETR